PMTSWSRRCSRWTDGESRANWLIVGHDCYRWAEEAAMVRFSCAHIPAYPLDESIKLIKVADELGFYAAYACDETWWKDMWLLFAVAARETTQIRLGPNV